MDPDTGRRYSALLYTEWKIPIYIQPEIVVDHQDNDALMVIIQRQHPAINAVTEASFGLIKSITTEIIEEQFIGWVTPPSVRATPTKVTLHG